MVAFTLSGSMLAVGSRFNRLFEWGMVLEKTGKRVTSASESFETSAALSSLAAIGASVALVLSAVSFQNHIKPAYNALFSKAPIELPYGLKIG